MDNEKKLEKTVKPSPTTEDDAARNNHVLDLIYAIRPVLFLESIFGITRFCITADGIKPTDGKKKVLGLIVSSFYAILLAVLGKYRDVNDSIELLSGNYAILMVIFTFEFVVYINVSSFYFSEINIRIFTAMNRIDNVLQVTTRTEMYSNQRRRYIRLLLALFICHVLSDTSEYFSDADGMSYYRMLLWPLYFFHDMEVINFCIIVLMQKQRLQIINSYLIKMIEERKGSNESHIFTITPAKKETKLNQLYKKVGIRELASMYDVIGETCCNINTVFNFHLFMTLVSTFSYVVISIWTSLYAYRTGNDISGSLRVLLISGGGGLCNIVALSLCCQSLLTTRNETKVWINELIMDYGMPRSTRNSAKSFMELVEAWPLQLTVYDMFSVDITLILKFVSVSTTYLIVIIQISHFV